MKKEMSKDKLEKYIKFKQELELMKYELFGIVPKQEKENELKLKKK